MNLNSVKSPDILLVIPNLPASSWINALAAGVTPPLGIAYIASYLRGKGFKVAIFDNCVDSLSRSEFIDLLRKVNPKSVGFTISTTIFSYAIELASAVKEFNPIVPVIAGGPHPSALPMETLESGYIDVVVRGEGEETTAELLGVLLKAGDLSAVKGISYQDQGRIIENPPRPFIDNVDSLPFPAYDLLPMDRYHPSLSRRLAFGNTASIVTSRGCNYRCTFCSNSVFGVGVRFRSVANVIEEVELLIKDYNIKEIIFWDDTFTSDLKRAKLIAQEIEKLGANIKWSCYSRVDHASDDLYSAFYNSGCREILFGAESGSNIVLNGVRKQITVEQTENAVRLCKKYGISSFCSIIIGLPGDTFETVLKTLDIFLRLNPDYAVFCILVPMPGSELFRYAVEKQLIDPRKAEWGEYVKLFSSKLPPVALSEISREDLVKLQKMSFRRFFFRPGYILGRVGKCFSFAGLRKFRQYGRGFATLIKHQLYKFERQQRVSKL